VPVTADDVTLSVRLAVGALGAAHDGWDGQAGDVTWTCWETAEHIADDLFAYAVEIARTPQEEPGYAPFTLTARREGGPGVSVFADPASGPAGLLQVLDACGALLAAAVRAAPPGARGYHVRGRSDAEGFAAMGVVEVLVHTADIAAGLDVPWAPPADLCARVLARLFPEVEVTGDPWRTLLWATGRAELPGRPLRTEWRWTSTPTATG
jgi:hypothetical protein